MSFQVTTLTLVAHHSHWSKTVLHGRAGDVLRIIVRNEDPIDHEFIVGDAAVQDRHERGTEPYHPPRPGEISVPAGTTAVTDVTLTQPGTMLFGCHLPGHWDYGMHGTIEIHT